MVTTTVSNVNGYEVDNLPVRIGSAKQIEAIEEKAKALLEDPLNRTLKKDLDDLVYELYELDSKERKVIEKQTV